MTTPDPHARRKDPATSKAASRNGYPGWKRMQGAALRIYYENRNNPAGLTYWEAELLSDGVELGACPWHRCGDLHLLYSPPLITKVLDQYGNPVVRQGKYKALMEAYKITDQGQYAYWQMRSAHTP